MSDDSTNPSSSGRVFSLLLVVEDDLTANRLNEFLSRPEATTFEITRVLRVEEALFKLQTGGFDAMLIDLSVQEADGLDSLMRAKAAASSIPIVVLTYQRDEATAMRATRAGAQDYLAKGEVTPELISRTLVHAIERHGILQDLTQAKQRHRFLATHDSLTELPNRYWFMEHLQTALAGTERRNTQLAVFFLDLDGFKAVNDNLGHAIGDELLIDVAQRLRRLIRKRDLVARIGGGEFLIAVHDIPKEEDALSLADAIRKEIEMPYHLSANECWTVPASASRSSLNTARQRTPLSRARTPPCTRLRIPARTAFTSTTPTSTRKPPSASISSMGSARPSTPGSSTSCSNPRSTS